MEHFQWGIKNLGVQIRGGGILNLSKSLDFQQLPYFQRLGLEVKIHQVVLNRSMVILVDILAVLLRYFWSSSENLVIKSGITVSDP